MIKCTAEATREEQLADTLHEPDGRILCSVFGLLERLARDMAHARCCSFLVYYRDRTATTAVSPSFPTLLLTSQGRYGTFMWSVLISECQAQQ